MVALPLDMVGEVAIRIYLIRDLLQGILSGTITAPTEVVHIAVTVICRTAVSSGKICRTITCLIITTIVIL
jgi:hypothetical protein